jgi:hypothetical protein
MKNHQTNQVKSFYTNKTNQTKKPLFIKLYRYLHLVPRDNNPTKTLSPKAQTLASKYFSIISCSKNGVIGIGHKRISTYTNTTRSQNNRIHDELKAIFSFEYKKFIKSEGSTKRNIVQIKLTELGKKLVNNPYQLLNIYSKNQTQQNHSKQQESSQAQEVKTTNSPAHFCAALYSNVEDSNILYRSTKKSKFSKNSLSNSSTNPIYQNSQSQIKKTETILPKQTKKQPRPHNKQRNTVAKRKLSKQKHHNKINQHQTGSNNITSIPQCIKPSNTTCNSTPNQYSNYYHNNRFTLIDHHPLSEKTCYQLQKLSGRNYSTNGINQILLSVAKRQENNPPTFNSKSAFMKYFSLVLKNEIRNVDRVNKLGFRCNNVISLEEKKKIKMEKYLQKVEDDRDVSKDGIFKRKLLGIVSSNTAYNLLQSLNSIVVNNAHDEVIVYVNLFRDVELNKRDREKIIDLIKHLYGTYDFFTGEGDIIDTVRFSVKEKKKKSISEISDIELHKENNHPVFSKIKKAFVENYGESLFKSWFNDVKFIKLEDGIVTLSAQSDFIKSWIDREYLYMIQKSCCNNEMREIKVVVEGGGV